MSYQYQRLTKDERLAQIDANLPQLEQMLFQSEMTLRMNAHRPDTDENKIALQYQYEDNLAAIQALEDMRLELLGDEIIDGVTNGRRSVIAPVQVRPSF